MKLYINILSLNKFQKLFDSNEFVRSILSESDSNVYFIDTEDREKLMELERLLIVKGIKYKVK